MNKAYNRVSGQGQEAARNALRKTFEEIEVKIEGGELKPYGSKEV